MRIQNNSTMIQYSNKRNHSPKFNGTVSPEFVNYINELRTDCLNSKPESCATLINNICDGILNRTKSVMEKCFHPLSVLSIDTSGELKKNLSADVFFPGYPDIPFKAHITWISPVVNSASRSKQIELTLDKKDPRINIGMFPKVKLHTTVYEGYIAVPDDAVVTRAEQDYVFVVKGDIASRVPVKKLITIDNTTLISEGLSKGDNIVIDGMDVLVDGSKVNRVER